VEVTTTVTPLDRNRVAINFNLNEGEVAKIRESTSWGNRAFTEDELVRVLQLRTPGWFTWFSKNDQYSRQKLQADLETMRSHYLNAAISSSISTPPRSRSRPTAATSTFTINISEGEKYEVADVKLGGDLLVPEAELRSLITIKTGETFSREKLTDSTKAITDRLGATGMLLRTSMRIQISTREAQGQLHLSDRPWPARLCSADQRRRKHAHPRRGGAP